MCDPSACASNRSACMRVHVGPGVVPCLDGIAEGFEKEAQCAIRRAEIQHRFVADDFGERQPGIVQQVLHVE